MSVPGDVVPFADRLAAAVARYGPLCLGIDPHPGRIPEAIFGPEGPGSMAIWGAALARKAAGLVAAVKVQSAFFERWGAAGIAAMESVCGAATDLGLLVILDAKRGDIGSSARGYADAYLGPSAFCRCDAITLNPYLGADALQPFVETAEAHGKGLAVLARTSNPGAAAIQDRQCAGRALHTHVADMLVPFVRRLAGKRSNWSGLMLVVGATQPDAARALRLRMADAPFLVPGYGAQGGMARDALAGLITDDPSTPPKGLVAASRSLAFPGGAGASENGAAWEHAVEEAIAAAKRDLASAAAR